MNATWRRTRFASVGGRPRATHSWPRMPDTNRIRTAALVLPGRTAGIHRVVDAELPLAGDGPVIVHGDFAPYNIIVDPDDGTIRAVIDWELGHHGEAVEDLAWMEWNMRIWYSPQPSVLEAFYESYGELPAWRDRHASMLDRCERHAVRALRPSYPSPQARARWVEHLERTRTFTEIVALP